jgi:hypothetical protein
VRRRITAAQPAIQSLVEVDPFRPVYANITLHLTHIDQALNGGPDRSRTGASVANLEVSNAQRSGSRQLQVVTEAMSTHFVRVRTESELTYGTQLTFDQSERERAAVGARAAVIAGRSLRAVMAAAGPAWTDAQVDMYVTAYLAASTANPELHAAAGRVQAERARTASLNQRFGGANVLAARASAEQGLTARQSAAQTHWSSDRDRRDFVAAYIEITREVPAWANLQAHAVRYAAELDAAELEPLHRYLQTH